MYRKELELVAGWLKDDVPFLCGVYEYFSERLYMHKDDLKDMRDLLVQARIEIANARSYGELSPRRLGRLDLRCRRALTQVNELIKVVNFKPIESNRILLAGDISPLVVEALNNAIENKFTIQFVESRELLNVDLKKLTPEDQNARRLRVEGSNTVGFLTDFIVTPTGASAHFQRSDLGKERIGENTPLAFHPRMAFIPGKGPTVICWDFMDFDL